MVDFLRRAPFDLDQSGIDWVERTLAAMGPQERAGQLFIHFSMGADPGELSRLSALAPAGITRFFSAARLTRKPTFWMRHKPGRMCRC